MSNVHSTGCFKKSFTTLKAYRNLYRGHTQRFELSKRKKDASLPARRCTPSLPWRSVRVSQHPFPRSVDR